MILSHRAASSLNMRPYRAIWNHIRPNSMVFENTVIPKFAHINFQIYGKSVHIHRKGIFFESVAPQKLMQNGIDEMFWGQTFKNTKRIISFQFMDL